MKEKNIEAEHDHASGDQNISKGSFVVIAALAGVAGGAVALVMVALMAWLSGRSWSVDRADSHGISEMHSSRLGGLVVFIGVTAFFLVGMWASQGAKVVFWGGLVAPSDLPSYMVFAALIALVGLWDDFFSGLSPIARLIFVSTFSFIALVNGASLMTSSAYSWLPFGLNNPITMLIAGTFVVTGFVNAGNLADGANGLLCTVAISFFCVQMIHGSAGIAPLLVMSLLVFLVFNVVTGRLFLGDFGAYGLAAIIAFESLRLYATGGVSIWFLGSLLAYPCIEMVRIIVFRALRGVSPLRSGNDHLHNHLYELLRQRGWSVVTANSATGCFLGLASASLPACLSIFSLVDIADTRWWGIYFAAYCVLHFAAAFWFGWRLNAKRYGLQSNVKRRHHSHS